MNSAVILLERAARIYGENTAVEDETAVLTYKEYRERSCRIGTGLLKISTGRKPVLVYLPKEITALCCFMGAMYAGRPYAPVDSRIPRERLQKIIENLDPGVVITNAELYEALPDISSGISVCLAETLMQTEIDEAALEQSVSRVTDADPIYVMYTSGSTGTPKGVAIPHRGIIDYSGWVVSTFRFDETTVMANQAPFYFDNSTFDIYGSLRCGGRLVLIPDSLIMFPVRLPEFLEEKRITSIFWVPTVMINVANSGALEKTRPSALKTIAFCGEVMPNKALNVWRRALPDALYANLYGPTEITDVCSYYIIDREFDDAEPLPLGRACENMRVHIITDEGREAGPEEQGELCVVGSGVALGYWGAPELTEKAFVQNPLIKKFRERMYRTGDLAYRGADGLIYFCGRRDSQIKIKGNRVELGEIENAAMCVEGVENAAALFVGGQIVLCVETQGTLPFRRFNMELKKHVPQYMLPGKLVAMERLPHTANDKINRVLLRTQLEEGEI